MAIEKRVGIEVEFFVLNKAGEVIIPEAYMDRDDFPILGEIRALPGKNMAESVGNFHKKKLEVEQLLLKTQKMSIDTIRRIKLKVYQKATKLCKQEKNEMLSNIENLYGTNISDYSDQIVKGNKIQGINMSCGLHIHFSCRNISKVEVSKDRYELVELPISVTSGIDGEAVERKGVHELIKPSIRLHRFVGTDVKKTLKAQASLLNQPTIEYIVRHFDEKWFKQFAPAKADCTKYRQPGFYERKSYGFEYRSLPATTQTIEALPDMVNDAFELLKFASK